MSAASLKEHLTQALDSLSEAELQLVADYIAFLRFRARLTPPLPVHTSQPAMIAEEGSREYLERVHAEETEVTGVYRNGQIVLTEAPALPEGTQVIVTFLNPSTLDLAARGIDPMHAAELRARLRSFAEDWDRADMDVYNEYDTNKSALQTR